MRRSLLLVVSPFLAAAPAFAGETPLYQAAPAWVTPAALDPAAVTADSPALLVFDAQQRIEDGRLWMYSDTATRVASAENLAQLGTLVLAWLPDKGDLIVHDLTILRGSETIDLLAGGKAFTVLRREEGLEQRQLTGLLSATAQAEGLRVGDILRLRYSTTIKDGALAGRVQHSLPLPAAPFRIGFGRLRMQWDAASATHWKLLATGVDAKPVQTGGFTELQLTLPAVKQPEMPGDAPARFRQPPLIEISTFADWADVSRVMAPLYRTEGLIAERGPLAAEVAKVKAAPTPLERAQRALQLVQDDVRYLAVGMNGGNYVPQTPEQTWALRYGDCKAKTLLLLALLRASGIEAEAVLVHSSLGDLVPERLPSAGAFDHVIVRAIIDGESLWLDGTRGGARIADIRDTPAFRNVLPVRPEGAGLMPLAIRKSARPMLVMEVEADESSSVDLPTAFNARAVLRGEPAMGLNAMAGQLDQKQRDAAIEQFFTGFMGESVYSGVTLKADAAAGTTTLTATGTTSTPWRWQDKKMKRWAVRSLNGIAFNPDRARTSWASIPVATPDPASLRFSTRIKLPQGGRGFTIEGERDAADRIAGREMGRTVTLADGIVTVEERLDTTGAEIAVADIPAERDRLATIATRIPKLVAPADTPRRWEVGKNEPKGATQLAAIEATYAKAIAAAEPDENFAYLGRARLRSGIGDRAGALADLDKAIAIAPDVDTYLLRIQALHSLGRLKEAITDAEKARTLDPSSAPATGVLADLLAETGDLPGAVALLDQRIALGGEARDEYRQTKAAIIGKYGEPAEALALIDALIADKPGNPELLNSRCWIKGTRSVMIDSALKDCTSAIELSSNAFAALDSRAVIWFRMGRNEEALQDLNAVLGIAPGLPASLYMRGVVLNRMGRGPEGAVDLAAARLLAPRIDADYALFGIKP